MTRKLEEELNLPPIKEALQEEDSTSEDKTYENEVEKDTVEEVQPVSEVDIENLPVDQVLAKADKIDAAIPQVTGLDGLDKDMDTYAQRAMETYEQLCDLGMNVEDRHAGQIFDVASKMMQNAISAKVSKAEKKLKMVELQLRKQRLDHDSGKHEAIEGQGEVLNLDRNSLLQAISKSINDK